MGALADFLSRNAVSAAATLPLVHTKRAYALRRIIEDNEIAVDDCDVFHEDLNYFFMGRPVYKFSSKDEQAAYWELPVCFIFEYATIPNVKRVYPFDTGAHHLGLYPDYVQIIKKEEFDVSTVAEAPGKIIGAFFGDARSYLDLSAVDERQFEKEHQLGALDAEVRAIHRLAQSPAPSTFDDRRLTIELQSTSSVDLKVVKPIAVVLPQIYMDTPAVRDTIVNEWSAEPLTYRLNPLSVAMHYGQVYDRVLSLYEARGYL
jgi:hypothetical protein